MDFETLAAELELKAEEKEALQSLTSRYGLAVDRQTEVERLRAADLRAKEWDSWKEEWWDEEHGMTKLQFDAIQEKALLEAKLAEIKGASPTGANMTFEELETHLQAKGYLTKEAVGDLVQSAKTEAVGAIDGKLNQANLNQEFFFTRSATIPMLYAKEFGSVDDFDMDAFVRFVASGGERFVKDPTTGQYVKRFDAAYNEFVAGKRLQVQKAELDRKAAELEAKAADLETKKTAVASPTDDSKSSVIPPFQRQIQGMDGNDTKLGEGAPLGSNVLSAQAWELYKQGNLPGVNKPN